MITLIFVICVGLFIGLACFTLLVFYDDPIQGTLLWMTCYVLRSFLDIATEEYWVQLLT